MTQHPTGSSNDEQAPSRKTTVAVVGAGMSGLIAARALQRQGLDVLVLESADRTGGRMMADTSALGSRFDLGGQWIGHGHHRFSALAAELGTTVFPMHTPKRPTVVRHGRTLSAVSPSTLLASAALVVWQIRAKRGAPKRWNSTTVQEWLNSLPSAGARRLLEVLVEVSTTADLERFSMDAFAKMIGYQGGLSTMLSTNGGAQESLIVEGAGTLTDRIAAELGPRVLTGSRVTSISRDGHGVVLRSPTALVRASKAIVSVPPPAAAAIAFDPPHPAGRHRLEQNTYMGSVYKAVAVYRQPFWRSTTDAEFMFLDHPGFAVFDTSPPGGPGHLCVLVGGREARELDGLDEAGRRRAILGPVAAAIGSPEILRPASWHEKSWHLDEHAIGGYSALPTAGNPEGAFPFPSDPIGDIHWAGTETASEHAGYIEGAIESGERAAREVIQALRHTTAAVIRSQ
ncbi:flavin monoamine oxidase family protein [Rhodococcus opacus]|uniref:Putative flavin-containing amine oxidase n=1 Tax=Rhodococcus opacus (strain B4) TaxID=632772 RepID=C1ARM5_RHOOB|nr:NAD(P)/FAD-dependent oxidoreductase [Rhodococcus opacus]BAH48702.1 putative flavin-containing amine oxidase [Rhodococcus opacus B4]